MKVTLPEHETGNTKKRGRTKKNTNTNTPSPRLANPERARKRKAEDDGKNGQRPAEGGEDGRA